MEGGFERAKRETYEGKQLRRARRAQRVTKAGKKFLEGWGIGDEPRGPRVMDHERPDVAEDAQPW